MTETIFILLFKGVARFYLDLLHMKNNSFFSGKFISKIFKTTVLAYTFVGVHLAYF
jgi:hypothetical protein